MRKALIAIVVVSAMMGLSGCESCSRMAKSIDSDFGGGLNRKVTLYDYNGKVIDSWEGKFDVSENDQECAFDKDGKRIIIQGGIIVNEEL